MIENDLFLRALRGETVQRPPVWLMRQAGRYIPEFMTLKAKYDFFTRCQTPELATQITLMPIDLIKPDAAILFSDILVVLQAMNLEVEMKNGVGPWVPNPVRSAKEVNQLVVPEVEEALDYVFSAIRMTKKELNDKIPLIGFAGSPWTLLCYAVQGQGSKTFDVAKKFCYTNPKLAHEVLQKITDTTIAYLTKKVENGVNALQLFDSWGGLLSPHDYREFSLPYLSQIVDKVKELVPTIVFAKGCWYALEEMSTMGAAALGIDWTCSPQFAREKTKNLVSLQGNFDPTKLHAPIPQIQKEVHSMIDAFGTQRYIVNLGHGILPDVPVSHAQAFVEAVKSYVS